MDDRACAPFLTGAGGFLQFWLNGIAGIRLREHGLQLTPHLPEGIDNLCIHGLQIGGKTCDVSIDAGGTVAVCGKVKLAQDGGNWTIST